jgi:hypothetical protein
LTSLLRGDVDPDDAKHDDNDCRSAALIDRSGRMFSCEERVVDVYLSVSVSVAENASS